MVKEKHARFREIDHTADWEIEVWGKDLPDLLKNAAEGMYMLSNTQFAKGTSITRQFELPFLDRESFLVDFLTELLFLGENKGIGFFSFEFRFDEENCHIEARGAPIESQAKEVKAVTFHNLMINEIEKGLHVNIVFDV
jgi:SHS2 domain-containing protein